MSNNPHRRASITLFVISCLFFWISLYTYVPTLPTYAESKSSSLELVGVVLMQYGLWQTIIRIPVGILSDWIGRRKPFVLGGMVLAGAAALIMGHSSGVGGLILGRAVSGLAAGAWVVLIVAFSSLFPPDQAVRASTLLNLVASTGRVLATGSNGWLIELQGYAFPFTVAALGAILAVLFLLPVREKAFPGRAPSLGSFFRLASRRDVMLPTLLSTLGQYVAFATTLGFVPIVAEHLGASHVVQSLMVSGSMIVGILGNLLSAAVIRRMGSRRLVVFSFVINAAGVAGAAIAPSLGVLYVAQFLLGISKGAMYPVLLGMSIEHVEETQRSTAMGVHQAVYGIGMTAGPAVSGIIAQAIGIPPMFMVTAVVCLVVGVAGALLLERGTMIPAEEAA